MHALNWIRPYWNWRIPRSVSLDAAEESGLKRWRTRRVVGVAIAAVMLGGLAGWWTSHRGPDSSDASHPFHFTIPALSHDTGPGDLTTSWASSSPALSPDGKHLVYGWQDKLWLRCWERENLKSWKAPSRANGHFGQRIAIQLASSPTNRTAASGALPFPAVRRKESALSPTLCGLERGARRDDTLRTPGRSRRRGFVCSAAKSVDAAAAARLPTRQPGETDSLLAVIPAR